MSSEGAAAIKPRFCDRAHAGQALARTLRRVDLGGDVTVIGLACGGVPVAREVADALGVPLGVMVSRKIGVPGIEEVALGAVAEGSDRVVADDMAWYIGVPSRLVDRLAAQERVEVERRAQVYRAGRPLPDVKNRTVILVDDGLATGATLRAAALAIRNDGPRRIIAAVPVASLTGAAEVRIDVDDMVATITPRKLDTIASWYDDYTPVRDDEVLGYLGHPTRMGIVNGRHAFTDIRRDVGNRIAPLLLRDDSWPAATEEAVAIPGFGGALIAEFGGPQTLPGGEQPDAAGNARGLVILTNGDGGSRHSYRNRYLAGRLRLDGYATLRVDLLTADERREEAGTSAHCDLDRITRRLTFVCDWVAQAKVEGAHRTILIGASTGAAAALATAARRPTLVHAVVARAGRVELAADVLPQVSTPVLLIVGATDRDAIRRNGEAMRALPRGALLIRVPRAGHTFTEPGALGAVAEQAVRWLDHLDRRFRAD